MTLGYWVQAFAFGYFTVQLAVRAGSPESGSFYLGLVAIAQDVPALAVGPFGGVPAGRVARRGAAVARRRVRLRLAGPDHALGVHPLRGGCPVRAWLHPAAAGGQ